MKPVTEQELIQKAAGERVTLEAVNAAIVSEHYFTALQGARMDWLDTWEESGGQENATDVFPAPLAPDLGLLTICVLRLWNGFTVQGQSACADPANYNRGDRPTPGPHQRRQPDLAADGLRAQVPDRP
jgi:hypothetical protein